ncbi:MAG: hypothetical protein B6I30_07800 [Desulfobacteraceae bacterium 4572_187]|nr:MAG: hypothetical protein B6I30_07800 [Desulfobacteraceae bacterium 4572_187]
MISADKARVRRAQKVLVKKCVMWNEVQKLHFGYGFPLFVYTHDFGLFDPVSEHVAELDERILAFDMCDSLRRRHIALAHGLLPVVVQDLAADLGRPLTVKNLGSGAGLDTLHAASRANGHIAALLNYDTDKQAVSLGQRVTRHLEHAGLLEQGVVEFIPKSLTKSVEPADLIVKIGVICGLQDPAAQMLIAGDYGMLNEGGKLVISSSNENMRARDPLASFLIQHIGTREDPKKGWGLNFRKKETLYQLLNRAGFSNIQIYDDANYPGKDALPDEILYGVETLPAKALGYDHPGAPLGLPPKDVLDQNIGYNWIAVATK